MYHDSSGKAKAAKRWAILPFNVQLQVRRLKGDSGSVIVDDLGRISGLLTSGADATRSLDMTYATLISFLRNACVTTAQKINPSFSAETHPQD